MVTVRGNATAEEVAAVLAVVAQVEAAPVADAYATWRSTRLAAVRQLTAARAATECATIGR